MNKASTDNLMPDANRLGFSLIELAACLVIIGMLAGAASLSLRGVSKQMSLADVIEQLQQFDELWRQHAVRHGQSSQLVIDLGKQTLYCQTRRDNSHNTGRRQFSLPDTMQMIEVRLADESVTRSAVAITCTADGVSPTYAVALEQRSSSARTWFIVAGLTGQVTTYKEEEQVDAVLAALKSSVDAH